MIYRICELLKTKPPLFIKNAYYLIMNSTSSDLYLFIKLIRAKKEKIKYFIFYPKNLIQEHNYKRMLLVNIIKDKCSNIDTTNPDELKRADEFLKQIAELEKTADEIIRKYIANPINANDEDIKQIRKTFKHIKIKIGNKNV